VTDGSASDCASSGQPGREQPDLVGHRGAAGLAPENTPASLSVALEYDVDRVEVDVRETADGEIVCCHDATLDRTTDGSGPIADLSLSAVQSLDAGDGQRVPTLAAVLDLLAPHDVDLVVELKEPIGEAALSIVREHDLVDRTWFLAFDADALDPVADSAARTGEVTADLDAERVAAVAARDRDHLGVHHEALTPDLLERAHSAGLLVGAWTVNEPAAIHAAWHLGVDSVTTDRPDVARAVFAREDPARPDATDR
jgi:glycerophosphoryl diester phosphodiesterase